MLSPPAPRHLLIEPRAMSSTIFAPGVPQAMRDLHSASKASATLLISIYIIGLAVGPLLLSPLSETYGRTPIMHGTNVLFLVASVVCALSVNIPMLMIFRFLLGVSTVSLGGGYVADLMAPGQRQRAMNVWTVGPVLVGPRPQPSLHAMPRILTLSPGPRHRANCWWFHRSED